MGKVDVTRSVMEKITRYERERSGVWVLRFRAFIGVLLGLAVLMLWRVWMQMQETGSLDLLSLFWEDAEIIREFWKDTMSVFWEELPQEALVVAGVVLLSLCFVIWWTRKKRKIITRRLTELAKRK